MSAGTPTAAPHPADQLPPKIRNAYWFQAFNAVSWQICAASPLILFARDLGASATTLGLLAGLGPLLSIIQLPVSRYAEDIGYMKLMLMGWSSRVMILLLLTLLPFLSLILPSATLVNLLLAIMFFFNLMRGASMGGWLPLISTLVPPGLRGYYLSRDRTFINLASVFALVLSGSILNQGHGPFAYSAVFFASFAAGGISLYFLRRVPSEPRFPETPSSSEEPISWREVWQDAPFRKLLLFSVVVQFALSANGTFVVVFLREDLGMGDGNILWFTAGSALLGIVGLNLLGRHTDRVGSKPYIGLVGAWWLAYFLAWLLLSIHAVEHSKWIAGGLVIVSGFFGSVYELSVTRLLLNTVGNRPGRTRYFALYSVVVSLVMGLMPVPWGMALDALSRWHGEFAGFEMNRFSIFFSAEWLMLFAIGAMLVRLKEPKSQTASFMVYEIFVGMPSRTVSLLLQRIRE